ncbi:MAG: DUF4168 domain-containing protein [Candidatus Omnitrophota bacterium]
MILKSNKNIVMMFSVLLALVLMPASGWSQEYGSQQQEGQNNISSDQISSFVKAQNQVAQIRQEYQEKLSNVEDQEQQQPLVEEMNEKMITSVQEAGLDVEEYNEIFNAVQNDPALQQRVNEVMQQMQ